MESHATALLALKQWLNSACSRHLSVIKLCHDLLIGLFYLWQLPLLGMTISDQLEYRFFYLSTFYTL